MNVELGDQRKMATINKVDFFCGAFLSYIICNGVKEPTLFEAQETSKIVKFALKDKDYKIYIKYTTSGKDTVKKETQTKVLKNGNRKRSQKEVVDIRYTSWSVPFSNKERDFLTDSFSEAGKENIVVLVCTNSEMNDSYFAVLKPEEALKCLGNDTVNPNRYIKLKKKRTRGSSYVSCHGTALDESNAILIEYNIDNVFGFEKEAVLFCD